MQKIIIYDYICFCEARRRGKTFDGGGGIVDV
jgi:hypothetical protein